MQKLSKAESKVKGIDFIPVVGIATYYGRNGIDSEDEYPTTDPCEAYFKGWQFAWMLFGTGLAYDVGAELVKYAKHMF